MTLLNHSLITSPRMTIVLATFPLHCSNQNKSHLVKLVQVKCRKPFFIGQDKIPLQLFLNTSFGQRKLLPLSCEMS